MYGRDNTQKDTKQYTLKYPQTYTQIHPIGLSPFVFKNKEHFSLRK